jgi:steroid 5-alpha reductase family enzyme
MILHLAAVVFIYMTALFIVAYFLKDNSIADVFWGPGFVVICVFSILQAPEFDERKLIVSCLVFLWALRLSLHILLRNRRRGEDFRYRQFRETWKHFTVRSYFQIFLLQGFLMLIIAAPVVYILLLPSYPLGIWDNVGLFIFGMGFFFEMIGDYQLTVFRKDPLNQGKILTTGLWSLTRHPNYFGEALIWWGLSCYALDLPYGWVTLVSPVVITLLLRFVSGVPLLEKKYRGRADWEEYCGKTAPLVPFLRFF